MSVSGTPPARLDPTALLNRLDWQLSEVGRRQHRFSWLRDARSGDWIAVDSYYPGNRVVVVASEDPELIAACEDLVPGNGLFLLTVSEQQLSGDSAALAGELRDQLRDRGWHPRGSGDDASTPPPFRSPAHMTDEDEDEEFEGAPAVRLSRRARSARTAGSESERIGIGFVLVVVLVIELVLGGGLIGLDAGDYVLGFGFVLDAAARVLGMVVASQNDDLDSAWTSVLFGSFALWGQSDRDRGDLAPAARITAIVAGCVGLLGLLMVIL